MKRVLIVATYPIKNPQHGGQKRVDAIVRRYKSEGFDARFVAVFSDLFYDDYSKSDIVVKGLTRERIMSSPFTGDVECGRAIFKDAYVKRRMTELLTSFKPEIIQIEQVFPYIGLKPLLKELQYKPTIISSSHNIEYKMKQEMLEGLEADESFIDNTVKVIRDTETQVTQDAKVVAAVSQTDIKELIDLGAESVVLAPNGIDEIKFDKEEVDLWRKKFGQMDVDKIALFVGSAHPPNWFGFEQMVGKGLGFIPRNERIVFAGSISEYIKNELDKQKLDPGAVTFWQRAYAAGRLSQDRLSGLINFADTLLLPITEGGGSNLKTAEAVISGKKVVATEYAFRGFEELKKLPNIYIANDPESFREKISEVMSINLIALKGEESGLAKTVLWQNCLNKMFQRIMAVA